MTPQRLLITLSVLALLGCAERSTSYTTAHTDADSHASDTSPPPDTPPADAADTTAIDVPPADTDTPDTTTSDTATTDAATTDTASPTDTATADTSPNDTSPTDTTQDPDTHIADVSPDTADTDAAPEDTGPPCGPETWTQVSLGAAGFHESAALTSLIWTGEELVAAWVASRGLQLARLSAEGELNGLQHLAPEQFIRTFSLTGHGGASALLWVEDEFNGTTQTTLKGRLMDGDEVHALTLPLTTSPDDLSAVMSDDALTVVAISTNAERRRLLTAMRYLRAERSWQIDTHESGESSGVWLTVSASSLRDEALGVVLGDFYTVSSEITVLRWPTEGSVTQTSFMGHGFTQQPSVLWREDRGEVVVVSSRHNDTRLPDMIMERFPLAGGASTPTFVQQSAGWYSRARASIAPLEGRYMVAWSGAASSDVYGSQEVFINMLTPDGVILEGEGVRTRVTFAEDDVYLGYRHTDPALAVIDGSRQGVLYLRGGGAPEARLLIGDLRCGEPSSAP